MGYKDEQLGMSHSTARYRLQRQLLWKYVQLAGDDHCYRCGVRIEGLADLSIEHKLPWQYTSTDLFWDLENIAFSHLACNNAAARRSGVPLRKTGPEGTAWCIGHQQFLPDAMFGSDSRRWNGLHYYCRDCRRPGALADPNGARNRRASPLLI